MIAGSKTVSPCQIRNPLFDKLTTCPEPAEGQSAIQKFPFPPPQIELSWRHEFDRLNDAIGPASQDGFPPTGRADHRQKNTCLLAMADALGRNRPAIQQANART